MLFLSLMEPDWKFRIYIFKSFVSITPFASGKLECIRTNVPISGQDSLTIIELLDQGEIFPLTFNLRENLALTER